MSGRDQTSPSPPRQQGVLNTPQFRPEDRENNRAFCREVFASSAALFQQIKQLTNRVSDANTPWTQAMMEKMSPALHEAMNITAALMAFGNSMRFTHDHYDELALIKTNTEFRAFLAKHSVKSPEQIEAEEKQQEMIGVAVDAATKAAMAAIQTHFGSQPVSPAAKTPPSPSPPRNPQAGLSTPPSTPPPGPCRVNGRPDPNWMNKPMA